KADGGLLEPIVILDGLILEGRNRYRACRIAGIRPKTVAYTGECGSPLNFVIAKNWRRRQLSTSQKVAVAVLIEERLAEDAKKRQREHRGTGPGKPGQSLKVILPEVFRQARDQAAEEVGVSASYVSRLKKVKKKSPEVFEQVFNGEKTVQQALRAAGLARPK